MTESERREHERFDAYLRSMIANGEMTPEEAGIEWDYHFNGSASRQNTCGL